MKRVTQSGSLGCALAAVVVLTSLAGCEMLKTDSSRLMDPSRVVKAPKSATPILPIKTTISAADQTDELVPGATFPTERDRQYSDDDYLMGPGDVVVVSVLDLYAEGQETALQRQVSESGYIDLPLLKNRIYATGLNKEGLKEAVIKAYSPDILRDATVSIVLLAQRQSTFSIFGAAARQGQYNIVRRDMRLLEAISLAGGITQPNIRYVYVIRQGAPKPFRPDETGKAPGADLPPLPRIPETVPPATQPAGGDESTTLAPPATQPAIEPPVAPPVVPVPPPTKPVEPDDEPKPQPTTKPSDNVDEEALRKLREALGGDTPELPPPAVVALMSEMSSTGSGGAKKPTSVPADLREALEGPPAVGPAPGEPSQAPTPSAPADPFGWSRTGQTGTTRIIALDLNRLRAGNARMNIVIRDKDVIRVPELEVGEFYMLGEINRPGVFSLTGRRVTLKMALAAAGNFSPLAWPENATLTRRVGDAQEQVIPLNLQRIIRGQDPDIFLKPNDVISVGTDIRSSFLAVLRNAFRFTYGFGFIYDRNFGAQWRGSNPWTRW